MNCSNENDQDKTQALDKLIEELRDNLEHTGETSLPNDIKTLYGLYDRLIQRHRLYASDDLIADAALFFLEEEIRHAKDADAMASTAQSENDIHAAYQDMMDAIVDVLKENGECVPADLKAKGFSQNDIERRWAMAYALARVKLNWMDA
ncbi:MAG: hypothetical protein RBT70_04725 [Alphaproteobacteria bacterium]|jgi:hypothetical protein|nr:hypothetical protein [Alphaproteobacteria bacterium]